MAQREWVEKDFYKELGVTSDATKDEIKRAARKVLADNHPDRNPNNPAAEDRYKAATEAKEVLTDDTKRAEYDETRRLFANGGFSRRFGGGGGGGGFGGFGGDTSEFNLGDLFDQAGQTGGANIGDLFGGLFGRGAQQPRPSRPRRGNDLETETELSFLEATKGVAMPLRLTSPAPCTNCHGSGARPGTSPKVCPNCNGAGVINRNQGAFGFSEPCTDCRGTGSIIEHPCDECSGTGVSTRTRTINVRIPPGVTDGQRIRLAGQGEAGLRGAPSGDLYVTVHVRPDKVFGRDGDDLTVTVPVSFHELALGTTLSVPTLEGKVGVRVPKGTSDGRILRVRGRGVPKRGSDAGHGDLLVTVKVAVPPNLEGEAAEALEAYAKAERASGFDPRAGWAGSL
ncbi:molecular chaperone DnaJ [Mycobacterium sp. CBMA293]|uniref:molecular chaperone DnaJ n=1 Tax=unclassified Mycolicibacterium TaxID=2636767 RepID=UPI0012DEF234|nr:MULTISPECIES: molecular chaperone DnaJ [unclassified Mycolicibacterium]MUL47760.1 molecular chaperone DnaJ [Mycolicibacterium sp. CBMA 360]MUL61722.1 molecular chaperone DnaJ [Mycolicibacterium sp. CBMA 335]MUL64208.1 molecular chaperone DnaJ [Mycolicibacterium sp. CBMA 234]MUL70786.1 molecular chaperone DnaJ [Mycolicibacterium sp. CBMA 311]MUL92988.1 molecular chaperone DnaJ [Mycolicibacterium sp. CBMA 230]